MSLVVLPSEALSTTLKRKFDIEASIKVLTNLSEATMDVLSEVEFKSFQIKFDQIKFENVSPTVWNLYFTASNVAYSHFWNKMRCHLPSESLEANSKFDLRINLGQASPAECVNRKKAILQAIGYPVVKVNAESLFFEYNGEFAPFQISETQAAPEETPVQTCPLSLETCGRPGFYVSKFECQVQRFKKTSRFSGTCELGRDRLVVVEKFEAERAFISYPTTGWVDLKNNPLEPKWKRNFPVDSYELLNDVKLTTKCLHLEIEKHFEVKAGSQIQVLSMDKKSPTKLFVEVGELRGKIDLFYTKGVEYFLNIKPVENKCFTKPTKHLNVVVEEQKISDTASVATNNTALTFTTVSSFETNWTCTTNASTASSYSSKTTNNTVTRPPRVSLSTNTKFGALGLYQAKNYIDVFEDRQCRKRLIKKELDRTRKVSLKKNDIFEIVQIDSIWYKDQVQKVAEICGPFAGFILFKPGCLTGYKKTFKAGQHKVGYLNVEVVDEEYNFICEVPKWKNVTISSVEGCYAQIVAPVHGYVHLGQAMLKPSASELSLFFNSVPRSLTQQDLRAVLRMNNIVGLKDADIRFVNHKSSFSSTKNAFVKVASVEEGAKAFVKPLVYRGSQLSYEWSASSRDTVEDFYYYN